MDQISDLSKQNQRTVQRLSRGKEVSVDRITGLIETIKSEFYAEHPDATGMDWHYNTTVVNGSTPPGGLIPTQDNQTVVDKIVGGQHYLVLISTRLAGTRAGIHVHESGGTTFLIGGKGKITDYVQGFSNTKHSEGGYYYMPANIPMSADNRSAKDVRLMDIFITPVGSPAITIIEPGYPGYNPPA